GLNALSLPMITFAESLTLHPDLQTIELIHLPEAHTDGDLMVFFAEENVIHMGDNYVQYGWPYVDVANGGNPFGMIEAIDKVLPYVNSETKIIPGHGKLASRDEMLKFQSMLRTVTDRIQSMFNRG